MIRRIIIVIALLLIPVFALAEDVTLSWIAPDDDRVTGFYVYHGTNKPRAQVDVGFVETYTISAYNTGDTFYITATSHDAEGNESIMGEIFKVQIEADGTTTSKNLSIIHPGIGASSIQTGSGGSTILFEE